MRRRSERLEGREQPSYAPPMRARRPDRPFGAAGEARSDTLTELLRTRKVGPFLTSALHPQLVTVRAGGNYILHTEIFPYPRPPPRPPPPPRPRAHR